MPSNVCHALSALVTLMQEGSLLPEALILGGIEMLRSSA